MKIIINQKNLKKALTIVDKIVTKNNSLPILNNVLLKTENGRLKIAATNLEIGVNYFIGAKIDEAGEIAVPARIFSDFINNITDEKTSLSVKNNIININSDNYKTQILGLETKDFPIIPKIKTPAIYEINPVILKNSLLSVFDSVSLSETRPELAGVFVNFRNNNIIFASTDIFRLSEKTIPFKTKEQKSVILPKNTVAELIRIGNEVEGDLKVKINDNQISFSNDDIEIISRLVDGNYPDYKKVIPEKFVSRVLIKKEELEKNTKLAGLFTSNILDVKLICDDKNTTIIAKNSDKGEIETKIKSILKNKPFDISLNFQYLLDGIKNIQHENVVIEFTGQGSPLVIRPGDGGSDFVYLIMPLRS